jgi:hypothetical protein
MNDLVPEGVPLQLSNDGRVLIASELDVIEVNVLTTSCEEIILVDAEVNMSVLRVRLKGSGDAPLATKGT